MAEIISVNTDSIRKIADKLENSAKEFVNITNTAVYLNNIIKGLYCGGGVGERGSAVCDKMLQNCKSCAERAVIVNIAADKYDGKEADVEAIANKTMNNINSGVDVQWGNKPSIREILFYGVLGVTAIPCMVAANKIKKRQTKHEKIGVSLDNEELSRESENLNDTIEYEKYRLKVEEINEKCKKGQKQEYESSGCGLCTYSSYTTLLRRKQAADGEEPTYTFADVYVRQGGKQRTPNADGKWPGNTNYLLNVNYGEYSINSTPVNGISEDDLARELRNHPEGVIIYAPSAYGSSHAIVITDYELKENGDYQFYAQDPVNNTNGEGRLPLEQTWLSKVNNNVLGTVNRYFVC